MSKDHIDLLKEYVLQSTHSMEELYDEGGLRKIIYSDDDYVVFGITAYLKDIYADNNEIDKKIIFSEERGRPTYAFIGLVFPKIEYSNIKAFPKIECFISAIERYIVPRWNEKRHNDNVDIASLSGYDLKLEFDDIKGISSCELNISSREKVKVFNSKENEDIVFTSIREVSRGKKFSTCTNLAYKSDAELSFFMNASCRNVDGPIVCYNASSVKGNTTVNNMNDSEIHSYTKNGAANQEKREKNYATKKLAGHLVKGSIVIASSAYLIFATKKAAELAILSAAAGILALMSEGSVLLKGNSDMSKLKLKTDNNTNNLYTKGNLNNIIKPNGSFGDTKNKSEEDIFKL
jgi:hypothetical protein